MAPDWLASSNEALKLDAAAAGCASTFETPLRSSRRKRGQTLQFETLRQTAPPQACTLPEIDGNRPTEVGHAGLLFVTLAALYMGDARKPELANRYNLLAVLLDLGSGIGGVVVLAVTISNTCKEALPALLSQILPAGSRRRPRRTSLCSNSAMARAHRPLYRLGTAHLRHPGRPLCRPGTTHPCPVSFTTLRSSERCRDTPA